jgi:hypothetical protein
MDELYFHSIFVPSAIIETLKIEAMTNAEAAPVAGASAAPQNRIVCEISDQ